MNSTFNRGSAAGALTTKTAAANPSPPGNRRGIRSARSMPESFLRDEPRLQLLPVRLARYAADATDRDGVANITFLSSAATTGFER